MAVIDSYSETNYDTGVNQYTAFHEGTAQSFTGNGSVLGSIKLYLKKNASPTGNLTVAIYAHSGVFGTSSVPTGSALATSDSLDVSTLTTTPTLTTINFSGANQITLTAATNYVFAVIYSGGDITNRVETGSDTVSPTHGGNLSLTNSIAAPSWAANNTIDLVFSIESSAGLAITTNAATNIAARTATGNGNITDVTSGNADERGIVYSTSTQAAPGNVAPGSSGYSNAVTETGSFSTGAFTESLTGLSPLTRYYARAYAHNSTDGYIYGSEVNFITGLEVAWFRA